MVPNPTPTDPKVSSHQKKYTRWLNVLQNYHTERFTKNYQQYTAYTATRGTHTKISDPVAPELVERVVQKLFARDPTFMAMARGKNLPKEIVDITQSTASYFWTNPEKVQSSGSLRQKLKVGAREFCIIGNLCTETYYNNESDSPDFRVWPVEDVIFNPSMTLKTSNMYYFRQYVSLDYLESLMEQKDQNGKVTKGLFNAEAVQRVKERYSSNPGATMRSDPTPNQVMRSGSNALSHHVEDILMVSCWNPKTLEVCRIIDWADVIQEVTDPLGIDVFPYDFAMDIEVPKEPYGFGLLDFISGVTQAKDLFLNQVVDYGSRALNPPLFVDPTANIQRQTLRNAFRIGGIVFARQQDAQHVQYPPLPTIGFDLLGYLQQRAEGVSGISPYVGGVPNASTDKTKGTKGGIQALIDQAGSPIQDRQQNIEESIIEPIINKFLKLAGELMGKDEEKYVYLTGQGAKWVRLTKGILTGKITLPDLVTTKLISNEPPTDAQYLDPNTGKPQQDEFGFYVGSEANQLADLLKQEGKDPKSEILYDIDWIVRVETGSMAQQDAEADIQNFQNYLAMRVQYRIPTNFQAISLELANRMGIKNADQYDLDPGEPGNAAPFDLPRINVHFNDLPMSGKIQVAQNMGVTLTPQDFANEPVLPDVTPSGVSFAERAAAPGGPTYGPSPQTPQPTS